MNRRFSAAVCFANAAVLGYALHRLVFAAGEPDPALIGPTEHIPYFWRTATALWWGGLAALGGWRFPGVADAAARALPWTVAVAVAIAALKP